MADIPDITREAQDRAAPPPLESRLEVPAPSGQKAKRSPRTGWRKRQVPSSSQQRLVVVSNRVPLPKDGAGKAGMDGGILEMPCSWVGFAKEFL